MKKFLIVLIALMSFNLFAEESEVYEDELEPKKEEICTEMCDVCGFSGDCRQMMRTMFYSPSGTRFIIRHHPYCNPQIHFNRILKDYRWIKKR